MLIVHILDSLVVDIYIFIDLIKISQFDLEQTLYYI